jgi:hypothetical protein
MAILRRNPLAFPASARPGFNPAHPAAQHARFSAIATSGSGIDLLTGRKGTNSSTTFVSDGNIGPARFLAISASFVAFTGAAVNDGAITFGAVISEIVLNFQAFWVSGTNTTTTASFMWGINSSGQFRLFNSVTNLTITPSPALTAGQPYFVAGSYATGASSIVAVNLMTGVVSTGTSATAITFITPDR